MVDWNSALLQPTGLARITKDLLAAPSVAITLLPSIVAAGVIAFGPLGQNFSAQGLAAAIIAVVVGGPAVTLVARTRFVVSFSIPSLAAVQAGLVLTLLTLPGVANSPTTAIMLLSICVVASGLFIIVISLTGLAELIKFTPHPVLAGFKNGISLTLIWLQLKPYFHGFGALQEGGAPTRSLIEFLFLLSLVALIFSLDRYVKRIPAGLVTLLAGALVYFISSRADLSGWFGPTVGAIGGGNFNFPLGSVLETSGDLFREAWLPTAQFAVALALFTTLQSLVAFRLAQNLSHESMPASRALLGVGVGNIVSGSLGGLALAAASGQTASAYRNGARSGAVVVFNSAIFVLLALFGSPLLATIPLAAVSAIVIFTAISTLDSWSIDVAARRFREPRGALAARDWTDIAIATIVTLVTFVFSVVPGVIVGVLLACGVFILNMSRPVISRRLTGTDMRSKRGRTLHDGNLLLQTGDRRRVLQLSGVLFFGNAELLSEAALRECETARAVILDCRGITDIDASGIAIIGSLLERTKKSGKEILFCNLSVDVLQRITMERKISHFQDLDTALEHAEATDLAEFGGAHKSAEAVSLVNHEFTRGLIDAELRLLEAKLVSRAFLGGAILCRQGDPGDRMWLLLEGSVSIRIDNSVGDTRRLSSNGPGTSVGEMAFLEGATRSATLVADDPVAAYELTYSALQGLASEHPQIAAKLYRNLLLLFASRIRENHAELQAIK